MAVICGKWELAFNETISNEFEVPLNERSYLHFVLAKPEFVSAKCLATEWLLTGLIEKGCSLVEYLAGVGIQATIAKNLLVPRKHLLLERDGNCCSHLRSLGFEVEEEDANRSMFEYDNFDVKFADFPSSSVISVQKKWKGFFHLFKSKPKLVVWTDTACSYPLSIHGAKYAKEFGAEELESWDDYVVKYSDFLYKRVGYSIKRAAVRGKNAIYFAAVPGECEVDIKKFPLSECAEGFTQS